MTEQLKRYKPALVNAETPWEKVKLLDAGMEESEIGEWVKASDIPRIKADAVRDAIGDARTIIDSYFDSYCDEYVSLDDLIEYADKLERGDADE